MVKRLLAASVLLFALSCAGGKESDEDDAILVGAIFALTGATSDVGTVYAKGVRDYIGWANGQGGVEGRPIELLYQDYGYRVDRAEQLYSEFVNEGVVAFMGWGTGDTEALRGRISEDQVPFMSASYSHVLGDPTKAPYNFLAGTTYSDQFLIILDWIEENHPEGSPKVALLHHASPFGLSPYDQLGRDYAAARGIGLMAQEMPRGSTDFTSELTRLREWGAEYIVFQNTSAPVSVVLKNAASLSMTIPFFCLNWCANELLVELAGDAADGVVGALPFAPPAGEGVNGLEGARAFLLEKDGSALEDQGVPYGQGWWTMAIMTEGIRRVVRDGKPLVGENVKAALEGLADFDTGGVTFPITFTEENHRGAKGMRLFRVEQGRWAPLTDFRHAPSE